jgi:tetratricopeptide (TPR) repeat protein
VSDSENKLRHLAFFEEIASHEENDPDYRSATAGLVVLRLVDSYVEDYRSSDDREDWAIRRVRAAIEEISETKPVRAILGRVVDALEAPSRSFRTIVTPLMAYARSLEYEAKFPLATDVYQTVLAHTHPIEDSDASIAAHLRLGQCYRILNQIDKSAKAYECAHEIATATGDMVGILRARIGEGQIAMIRGNLPYAEDVFEDTISRANTQDLADVRSSALHGRANVAYFREQYERAIQFAYAALEDSQISVERDRILGDIAVSFLELGVYSSARDAYLVLSATAQEQYTRWAAILNLLEISALTGMSSLFDVYARQLRGHQLPPYMATAFELTLGNGYRRFGDLAAARRHLERAMAMAGEHGFNQYLFDAEEALLQLDVETPPRKAPADISLDTQEVALAIQELRRSVGV